MAEALAFSLQSVRLRLGRMVIVLVGVSLAVAFMTALYVRGGMYARIDELFEGAEVTAVEAVT